MGETLTLDDPIEELGFNTRTYNCFKRNNINTIGDLTSRTALDLIQLRSFGVFNLIRTEAILKKAGFALKDEEN